MKLKIYIQFITALVLFGANDAFSNIKNDQQVVLLSEELSIGNVSSLNEGEEIGYGKELSVTKKTVDGLSVYTFTPDIKIDDVTLLAVQNRLNVLVDGFVSLSVADENEVHLVLDPAVVTEERTHFSLAVVMKIYEYSNYVIKIEE